MRIAIVEDEINEANKLKTALTEYLSSGIDNTVTIDLFNNSEDFLAVFIPGKYAMVFFDIFMSGMTGVDAARIIRMDDSDISIIFCSASNAFASESYSIGASYYLHKPYERAALNDMFEKMKLTSCDLTRFIILPDGQKLILRDIIYSEYRNHVVYIHVKHGNDIKVRIAQNGLMELLSQENFIFSCSKGIIVNFYEVREFNKDVIIMKNDVSLPVSRRKAKETAEAFAAFEFEQLRREMNI